MGGDYLKQSFPLATNMAMLAWAVLRFSPAYKEVGGGPALLPGCVRLRSGQEQDPA